LLALFGATVFTLISCFENGEAVEYKGQEESRERFFTPEVVIAIIVPLVSAVTWLGKDYVSKNQELNREQFRGEIIAAFATTLEETRKEYEEEINIKLQPMHHLIEKIAEDIATSAASEKLLEKNLKNLEEYTYDLRVRMKVIESTIDNIVDKLNAELSAILTAYLKDPIKVKLFTLEDTASARKRHKEE
jgi:hypothetical protein